jgi:hypothetical protein
MKRPVSIRMPEDLGRGLRQLAAKRQMSVSQLVAWVLGIALRSNVDFSSLPDAQGWLTAKIDCRLPNDIISQLRPVCKGLGVSPSVYIRTLMFAGQTGRLAIREFGGAYTLVANHEQK